MRLSPWCRDQATGKEDRDWHWLPVQNTKYKEIVPGKKNKKNGRAAVISATNLAERTDGAGVKRITVPQAVDAYLHTNSKRAFTLKTTCKTKQ